MRSLFHRLRLKWKVPCPLALQASSHVQAAWKRGGLAQALTTVGISRAAADAVAWSDEMRLGLHGQVRRRWAPRGIKLRQRVEVRYEWRYLTL
jgi:hypothetical protein